MYLKKISISNYRSIYQLELNIEDVNGSNTFAFLGINESGKSSILQAISLLQEGNALYPQDFFDEAEPIEIRLIYHLNQAELKELQESLIDDYGFDKYLISNLTIEEIEILGKFEPKEGAEIVTMEIIRFKQNEFPDYTVLEKKVVKIGKNEVNSAPLNLNDFFSEYLYDTFWNYSHVITFWKSSPQYLIIDEIDLANFALDPKKISIPLRNCFILSGKKKIDKEIAKLKTPVSIQNLEELLSYKVTSHINKVWPEHPVKIKFKINNGKLTFLVEDKGVRFQNKTTNQRSDGFRQLVSFLLTLSAENESEELSNTILLLDEPETHLHPTAQLNLKDELIKISQNDKNNLVFFATHSNYLIDKKNIERCYKVYKEKNHKTKIERLKPHHSSFSEVNYEVFDISTNDYHTELFGYLEDMEKAKLNALPKTKKWNNQKLGIIEDVSLPRYIRHSIHHPENTKNQKFTDQELKESIDIMRKLKYG